MKSKFYLFGLVLTLLFSLNACKTKQSAYQAAYEAAKQKELEETKKPIEELTPVSKPKPPEKVQREKVTSIDGTGIQQFSLVVGSFINKTNAESLKERLLRQGYSPILAQNEKAMYRVIIATFKDKSKAAEERELVKEKFAPEFSDAWILEQVY
jgi:cell division protein FtsN